MRIYIEPHRGLDALFLFSEINIPEVRVIEKKKPRQKSSKASLTKKVKDEIRLRFIVGGECLKDLAEEYKVVYSYLRWISSTESWALLVEENGDEDLKRMYNEALVSKSYQMLDIYDEILEKAVTMTKKKTLNSKELVNLMNVITTVERRTFALLLVREEKQNG